VTHLGRYHDFIPVGEVLEHAQWDMLGFPVQDKTGGYFVFALLPKSDVQMLDDWNTIGVRGSGSSFPGASSRTPVRRVM
jgi:hypothetical protein